MKKIFWLIFLLTLWGCIPKESVEFRKVDNVRFEMVSKSPVLKADIFFYNPNKTSGKLKKIELDILVNDKKAGTVNQSLNQLIEGKSEFSVPIEINVNMKELGLLDTLINLFGGKKYVIRMIGKVKVKIHGVGVNVSVDHKEEIKINL